ncbi:Hpt domain-containing protein [Nostoc sp. FACHB-888]|uniref:Hpt domain-containing protein n=1 Tax=Nostoc sp. FACHB-888 TaxID=2692842 RepID=UPI001685A183|nr:Hpt domain-containing protein [Nostoc sp. FACHB-888]MBD2249224.1 Hpt domain-containing protein [Nostoc sp. FACHB-888]
MSYRTSHPSDTQALEEVVEKFGIPNLQLVIDLRILQDLRTMLDSDGDQFVAELINIYLTDSPLRMQMIKDAAAKGERTKLQKASHDLRSPSVSIGAANLGKMCESLEIAAENQLWDELFQIINQIESEYKNVVKFLQSLIFNI